MLEGFLDIFALSRRRTPTGKSSSSSSTLGLAFEFGTDSKIEAKAYLAPMRSLMLHSNVYPSLMRCVGSTGCHPLASAKALFDYSSSTTAGRSLALIGVEVDCVKPERSRIKVYARSKKNTIGTAKEILTLGNSLSLGYLNDVENLWQCLFEKNVSNPRKDHETAGLLYVFDINTAKTRPPAKIYLPIRHYCRTDQDARHGLGEFLKSTGQDTSWLSAYIRVVQSFEKRSGFSLGSQTYISLRQKRGKVSLISYLSPQTYRS